MKCHCYIDPLGLWASLRPYSIHNSTVDPCLLGNPVHSSEKRWALVFEFRAQSFHRTFINHNTYLPYLLQCTYDLRNWVFIWLQIKIWFQNRRARERREKSGSITPPRAVTLPSTASCLSASNNAWLPISNSTLQPFDIRQNSDNLEENVTHNTSTHTHNGLVESSNGCNTSQSRYLNQSCSSASDDSIGSRCDSPLDVESVDWV